jgi:hypothetical protein
MKIIDLKSETHSVDELIILAKSETVLIHSADGFDFILEEADEFDREVASLGSSDKFMSFLGERSEEETDISFDEVAKKRGIEDI